MILKEELMRRGLFLFFFLFWSCATLSLHDDLRVVSGKIEGQHFVGIRYPFRVSIPPHWKMTTEFPEFLKKLGYEEPAPTDKEVTELYIYQPLTQTTIQIDFTPANPKARFTQEKIEALASAAAESLKRELEEEYGKGINLVIGPTLPYPLRGVPYAARKYASYTYQEIQWERGWIYGFSEPYQIFILYLTKEKEGSKDRVEMEEILKSFEVLREKG